MHQSGYWPPTRPPPPSKSQRMGHHDWPPVMIFALTTTHKAGATRDALVMLEFPTAYDRPRLLEKIFVHVD